MIHPETPARESNVDAHEAGHLMGAEDHHDKPTGKPEAGWEGNMAEVSGSPAVDGRNLEEILAAPENKVKEKKPEKE